MLLLLFAALSNGLLARTAPLEPRQSTSPLSTSQISTFDPFTYFASAAYCQPSTTRSWTCGANCQANSDFVPVASGGDGGSVQFWYVGYSSSLNTVIVAHQGTDTSKIQAIATDVDAVQEDLNPTLFPNVPSGIQVHSGFANEQAKTATSILSGVRQALSTSAFKQVTVVGHSLGGAIALLDGIYLTLQLSGISVKVISYGMPRVGNQDFADYVDARLQLTHINNKKDPIPILPGRFLGYHHPSGEIHITESGPWESCPGHDNLSKLCTVGDVPNIFVADSSNHHGPYNGITMSC